MRFSTSSALVLGLSALDAAYAHTVMDRVYVNGEPQGAGTCVRVNPDGDHRNFFVGSLSSNDMACGIGGGEGVSRLCPSKAGDVVTFEWNAGDNKDGHIADSHKGPCSIMMKKVDSATTDSGAGPGWFRIFYEGFNKETGKWCTERMMKDGHISVKIPSDLATGEYLMRSELLALHSASTDGPQFYVGCFQTVLTAGGTVEPKETVAIPSDEYAKAGSDAMKFNYYYPPGMESSYQNYGPKTYVESGKGGNGPEVKVTKGLKPEGCIFEAGNWCGMEVKSYSDQDGCWASAKECWTQGEQCWKSVIVDYDRCKTWQAKCENIGKQCEAKNFNGPPNAGKDFTVEPRRPTCPPPLNDAGTIQGTSNGDSSSSSSASSPSGTATSPSSSETGSGYDSASGSSSAEATSTADAGSGYGSASESASESASPSSSADAGSGAGDGYGSASESASPSSSANAGSGAGDGYGSASSTPSASTADAGSGSASVTPTPSSSECPDAVTETVTETATATVTVKANQYRA